MELVVQPLGRTLHLEPGANLLAALREHQVPISYSCTAGRCGTCRCKVLEGEVLETGRDSKITHPDDEGYVLACMSVVTGNCVVEVPEPDEVVTHPARIVKATVLAIEPMTHDIRRLRLKPAKPLEFSPGQYATLQFGPELARPYSMANVPGGDELEFHVRLVPDGRVTGHIEHTLAVGDAVRVSGPLGTAYLRRKHEGPMLCVAGGTGLAPVLSIVRGALAAGMEQPIHLYFGVRTPRDVYGLAWLEELRLGHPNLHLHVVVSTGNDDPQWRSGLVTDAFNSDWDSLAGWRAYLCGAPPMVEAAAMLARKKGVPPEHVYADAFYPSGI
ncbi:2Fe-2S iron-sulfur cluster-binding protein [Pseudoduganella namucuonensis]|uniref:Ferredoxin-NAD(P)+ reductase (Naphthalene dioxygenase ferredoxin-specific) n=1 Tax=Pseudoduganella namucuonensis TaxID=1035707 RepID=A0A1I7GZZ4_9BURK|nr:2Fe-2S iron-sulfur cluster-binding protein [Pseudoduganella namucuonensis]SFU54003.1 ferredoxin-NAD(P)+ reductase (naphthalene dioxygenase ferredoxin-specific) [Pseudoduganella namucuonensis]